MLTTCTAPLPLLHFIIVDIACKHTHTRTRICIYLITQTHSYVYASLLSWSIASEGGKIKISRKWSMKAWNNSLHASRNYWWQRTSAFEDVRALPLMNKDAGKCSLDWIDEPLGEHKYENTQKQITHQHTQAHTHKHARTHKHTCTRIQTHTTYDHNTCLQTRWRCAQLHDSDLLLLWVCVCLYVFVCLCIRVFACLCALLFPHVMSPSCFRWRLSTAICESLEHHSFDIGVKASELVVRVTRANEG